MKLKVLQVLQQRANVKEGATGKEMTKWIVLYNKERQSFSGLRSKMRYPKEVGDTSKKNGRHMVYTIENEEDSEFMTSQ